MNDKKQSAPPNPLDARKRLTFEQAEGVEPLPTQLKLKEMSQALRAALWAAMLASIDESTHAGSFEYYVGEPWSVILKDNHIYRLHRMADEFNNSAKVIKAELKTLFQSGDYVRVFGFLQFVIRHPKCPYRFADKIEGALQYAHAAYRVVERTIIPIGSEAERDTIKRAFADLAATEFHGARQHLRNAAEELTTGKSANSIRESIHAVESVVRVLEPKGDFAKALAKLDTKAKIHGALRNGFSSIYGFTSDEKGVRHPLLDDPEAKVDKTDALFMIGACAAFVSYLINKARFAGLLNRPQTAKRGKIE